MKEKLERRAFTCDELRVLDQDEANATKPKLRGHAAVFNSLSERMYGFREIILPGAFTDAIVNDDVRALWNHNPDYVLGRNRAKTLGLSEDATGLAVEIDPPDTQWARDLLVSIRRGDVTQMSFGFQVLSERWEKKDGEVIRTLTKLRLFDVSPVTYPAYPATDVSVRSLQEIAAEGERALVDPDAWKASIEERRRRLELDAVA